MGRLETGINVVVHKADDLKLHATIYEGGDGGIVEYHPIQARVGPSVDSDLDGHINPNKDVITPIGKPNGGYQKVEVIAGDKTRIVYIPVNS